MREDGRKIKKKENKGKGWSEICSTSSTSRYTKTFALKAKRESDQK